MNEASKALQLEITPEKPKLPNDMQEILDRLDKIIALIKDH